ncbi:MAG: DUF3822 family protein [Prevotellaceae bacterium]|jgi:hypothetical protein|nr:DUF3822 family protein [Prevotellaceae bacterium]
MQVTGNKEIQPYYVLSIRLSADGFSFSAYIPAATDSPVHSYHKKDLDMSVPVALTLRHCLASENIVPAYTFRQVDVMLISSRYTIVPLALFDDEQAERLLYFNHARRENETVLYQVLRSEQVVLFAIDRSVLHVVCERFPNASFYVQTVPMLDYLNRKAGAEVGKLYVYLHQTHIDVYCYVRGQLALANSFSCATLEDAVYYILYVWKQQGLEQQRDELHLMGEYATQKELAHRLRRFLNNVITQPLTSDADRLPLDMQLLRLKDY